MQVIFWSLQVHDQLGGRGKSGDGTGLNGQADETRDDVLGAAGQIALGLPLKDPDETDSNEEIGWKALSASANLPIVRKGETH